MSRSPSTFKLAVSGLAVAASLLAGAAVARSVSAPAPLLTVYKSETCGCCVKWVDHVNANGLATRVVRENDLIAVEKRLGVPAKLYSCHVTQVGDYLIVGHVPAQDIKRLLAEKPRARGLAVAGMPLNSPGMDMPGNHQPYETLLFHADGRTTVFARHR